MCKSLVVNLQSSNNISPNFEFRVNNTIASATTKKHRNIQNIS